MQRIGVSGVYLEASEGRGRKRERLGREKAERRGRERERKGGRQGGGGGRMKD